MCDRLNCVIFRFQALGPPGTVVVANTIGKTKGTNTWRTTPRGTKYIVMYEDRLRTWSYGPDTLALMPAHELGHAMFIEHDSGDAEHYGGHGGGCLMGKKYYEYSPSVLCFDKCFKETRLTPGGYGYSTGSNPGTEIELWEE